MSAVNGDPAMSGALPPASPRRLASATTRSRQLFTVAGLAVLAGAALILLATGHTRLRISADTQAPAVPWVTAVIPVLAGLVLIRVVPLRLPTLASVDLAERPALVRQTWVLVGIAGLFTVLTPFLGRDLGYGIVKVILLLGAPWLAMRIWRAPSAGRAHRKAIPTRWWVLGPVPAIAGWLYLSTYSPLAGTRDLSGYREYDRIFLAIAMVFVFLTASVTEEVFYRAILQTRLEALHGRWAGIAGASLLFAAMHVYRLSEGTPWVSLATILAFNGGFGVLAGYLWARYRNLYANAVLHGAVNAAGLLPLLILG